MQAEIDLWQAARLKGKVPPMIVVKRLTVIMALLVLAVCGLSGSREAERFPPISPAALTHTFSIGLLIPVVIFGVLDFALDASWWECLGSMAPAGSIMTNEESNARSFVSRPLNTCSSNAQVTAGVFILFHASDSRTPLASNLLGVVLVALGLASFVWWSSSRRLAMVVDNWLMEVHLFSLALAMLTASLPERERVLMVSWLAVVVLRWTRLSSNTSSGKANLWVPSLVLIISIFSSVASLGGRGDVLLFLGGLGTLLYGPVLKFVDTSGQGVWGTAAFHYAAAIGVVLLWAWTQTLPLPVPH